MTLFIDVPDESAVMEPVPEPVTVTVQEPEQVSRRSASRLYSLLPRLFKKQSKREQVVNSKPSAAGEIEITGNSHAEVIENMKLGIKLYIQMAQIICPQ